jgi:hypothetical protein
VGLSLWSAELSLAPGENRTPFVTVPTRITCCGTRSHTLAGIQNAIRYTATGAAACSRRLRSASGPVGYFVTTPCSNVTKCQADT